MKQFIVLAYDAKDAGALERRMAARPEHLEVMKQMRAKGHMIFGAALTDENDTMIGSLIACNVPSRAELDAWLEVEPFVVHNVWGEVKVIPSKLSPVYADLLEKAS